ncbi:MAG: hypothetical protein R2801_01860 [Chitinophagales bacterium]
MKNVTKILCSLLIVLAVACSKEGSVGPAGQDGVDGNANVTVYNFSTDFSLASEEDLLLTGISQTDFDNSIKLVYYKDNNCSNFWYAAPGIGCSSLYQIRIYTYNTQTKIIFGIRNPDGGSYTGSTRTITDVKVFVIPPSATINLRTSKPLQELSYEEACAIFNIEP